MSISGPPAPRPNKPSHKVFVFAPPYETLNRRVGNVRVDPNDNKVHVTINSAPTTLSWDYGNEVVNELETMKIDIDSPLIDKEGVRSYLTDKLYSPHVPVSNFEYHSKEYDGNFAVERKKRKVKEHTFPNPVVLMGRGIFNGYLKVVEYAWWTIKFTWSKMVTLFRTISPQESSNNEIKKLANKSVIDTILRNAEEKNNVHQPESSDPTGVDNRDN